MKRARLYIRVSTVDQHAETQWLDLRQFAAQRGFTLSRPTRIPGVSGTKARRPALDKLTEDARRHKFDVVVVLGVRPSGEVNQASVAVAGRTERLDINREQVVEDRRSRMSLTVVGKRHAISRASVCRLMKEFDGNSPAEEVLRSGRNTVAQVSL